MCLMYCTMQYEFKKTCQETNLTIALDERRSFSASRIGKKKGIVCSRTVIFSRNDLLSRTQWYNSQGSPTKLWKQMS